MSRTPGYRPYEPLLILKTWAASIWTVDGPEIGFSFAGLTIPCPTRMTVIKLASGDLWVHSPVQWSSSLADALAQLGPVRHLVAPNMNHYAHLEDWSARYPEARIYALDALAQKIGLRAWEDLARVDSISREGEISPIYFDAGDFRECAFFHHETRTVVFTDLMQSFEAARITNPFIRLVLSLGGATGPNGQPSIDMRFALRKHREAMLRSLAALEDLAPERIILSHGQCYETNALEEIQRAFAYL